MIAKSVAFPLDRIAAAIIALVIVKEGWEILVASMRVLLDASVDATTLEEIRVLIMAAPEVADIGELVARNSGRYLFVQANLIFRITDLKRAHLAKGRGLKVARFLLTYKPDVILCKESLSGKGPGYAFAEAGVETSQTQAKALEELVNGLAGGKGW